MKMKKALYSGLAFLIIFSCIIFPSVEAIRYCVGNELHENITVNGNVVHITPYLCTYGCIENMTAYGSDCSPSPENSVVIGFGLIGLFIFIIYTLPRVLNKKRGKR